MAKKRIVADVMLVKLARWLRLFGISVENTKYVEDARLLRYAKRTGSILLTSDKALHERARKKEASSILVINGPFEMQLGYVVKLLGITPSMNETICPLCNSQLVPVSKKYASKRILKKIAKRYDSFYYCRKCRKVYWHGSHWEKIGKTLKSIQRMEVR